MKKKTLLNTTSWIVLVAFTAMHSPSVTYADSSENTPVEIDQRAEDTTSTPAPEQTETLNSMAPQSLDIDTDEEDANPQGTLVSPSTNTAEKAKSREFFRNILIAGAAVVVAVVSILIVSNNNGKKVKKKKTPKKDSAPAATAAATAAPAA